MIDDDRDMVMLAGREQPDLVPLDMQLPAGGDGLVLDRLPASFRTRSIQFVVLAASMQKGIDEWVPREGVAGFLAAVQRVLAPAHP